MNDSEYSTDNTKEFLIERIAELEAMLAGRTTEVDRWIERFDRAVGKQQYIIEAQKVKIAELENEKTTLLKCHYNVCWELVELEKERESLLRLISYVKSIIFSKVKCSYASFKRPLEELLKD